MQIRGYGPVKEEAAARVRGEMEEPSRNSADRRPRLYLDGQSS
jgi:hypothetical protein